MWDFNLSFGNADYCDADEIYGWQYEFDDIYNTLIIKKKQKYVYIYIYIIYTETEMFIYLYMGHCMHMYIYT